MQELKDKVAFITGGASGIGFELARACGEKGMRIMLGDIDRQALDDAVAALQAEQIDTDAVLCDVTSEQSLRSAAEATLERFGKVHMLVNNAGVLVVGGAGDNSLETWRWVMDVNVMGVVYGVEIFLPHIRSHGEGGHILNTASVGGHVGFAGTLAYSTTKHAVIGYSESLADQLKDEGIGVSALCPGFTSTRIAETGRFAGNREGGDDGDKGFARAVDAGMSAAVVARHALEEVEKDALFIFTHPGTRDEVAQRWPVISAAFDAASASDIINSDPDAKRVPTKEGVENLYR